MWPGERERIAVWADELQAEGHPLGELVAISLRVAQMHESGAADEAARLARQAERFRLAHLRELLGGTIGELPRLRLRWDCGLIRSAYLPRPPPLPAVGAWPPNDLILDVIEQLLRLPVVRGLDRLHLDLDLGPDQESRLLEVLADPRCVAAPRRLVIGSTPRSFRRIESLAARGPLAYPASALVAALGRRGVCWWVQRGRVQAIPWAPGDHGSRLQRLEVLLASAWTGEHERLLGRALWDTSLRVRRRVLEALPELPDLAAPVCLAATAVARSSRRELGDLVERSLTRIGARPAIVAAVAANFEAHEPWAAGWLGGVSARSRAVARRVALPRIRSMLARAPENIDLRRALGTFGRLQPTQEGGDRREPEDETVAELLAKLGGEVPRS